MNKNYVSGRAAEYACVKALLEQGAVDARRTAGSHGPYDVIAFFPDCTIRLVQVKSGDAPDDVEKLVALPVAFNVSKELWHKVRGKRVITVL